jgi:hypothetical protein
MLNVIALIKVFVARLFVIELFSPLIIAIKYCYKLWRFPTLRVSDAH